MALLAGRDDVANFTNEVWFGFGTVGAGNAVGGTAAADGTATVLNTRIVEFGGEASIHVAIFEQVGAAGTANLIHEDDIVSAASPQSTTLTAPITITAGNTYFVFFYATSGEPAFRATSHPSAGGIYDGPAAGTFGNVSSSIALPLTVSDAGFFHFWNLDGTLGGPTPPTVDAGTGGSVESGSPFQLNATITPGSDASPTILWSVQSGVGGSFSATNIEDPTFTPSGVGDSTLLLTVTPNDGPAVTDTVVVTGTAVSVTSITVTGITGGANLTDLQYMIVSSPDMSIATILDQGSGETTDANGDLFIPMTPGPANGTQVWYFIKDVAGNNAAQGPATVTVT